MSENVILENKRGTTKLFKNRFVHEGQTYFITDMKQASLSCGFLEPTVMTITFKNGEKKDFRVGIVSNSSVMNDLFHGFFTDSSGQDLKSSTQQWVTAINMLIAMNNK